MTTQKLLVAFSAAVLLTLAGCPQDNGGDQTGSVSDQPVQVGSRERSFALYVPKSYTGDTAVPLVLIVHGTAGNGRSYLEGNDWAAKAEAEGFIAVAPDALPLNPDNDPSLLNPRVWNFGVFGGQDTSDIQFLDSVFDSVTASYNIDLKRVYLVGHSSGGGLTFFEAVLRPTRFAALGVVAAPFIAGVPEVGLTLPTIYIIGTADPVVPPAGGTSTLPGLGLLVTPLETTLSSWANLIGCPGDRVVVSDENGVETSRYTCQEGSAFEVVIIDGQGHRWPGGDEPALPAAIIGPTTNLLNATDRVWDFCKGHARP